MRFLHAHIRMLIALWMLLAVPSSQADAQVKFLGSLAVPGDVADASGVLGVVGKGTPHNLFGAISAIDYSGQANLYYLGADRGPLDGASQFQTRFHAVDLTISTDKKSPIDFRLISTTLLKTEDNRALVGALEAFDSRNPALGLRFDPEGLRLSPVGTLFVTDEYGPFLAEFELTGRRRRLIKTPLAFANVHASVDPKVEDATNKTGRAANGGWEGLAITPSGRKLLIATQKSLLQDRKVTEGVKLPSVLTRLLEIDLSSGGTRQFVYPLEADSNGVNEVLAVSETEFLIIERDSKAGESANFKRIYRFNTAAATDVSAVESLASSALPPNISYVTKTLLIDLLDPQYGFRGSNSPEKWEGLTFGPDLPDGRRLLFVVVDNDYVTNVPTLFAAFALDLSEFPRPAQRPTNPVQAKP